MLDPYKILGVPKGASPEQLEAAYREKLFKHHPDRGGDGWAFNQVQSAYEQLSAGERPQTVREEQAAPRASSPQASAANSATADQTGPPPSAAVSPAAMIAAGIVLGGIVGVIVGGLLGINLFVALLIDVIPGAIVGRLSHSSPG